ncbi:MAG: GNAT family N-acetyltransferase [Gammaproteobacteria bacterium]|nr:GNAT family N-acetyltransferase [Gammaproteobacteria bacterium]MBU1645448.1 GNAT family N-acetyltransferase [Gammaproteobacteria bacterium]MBU1971071.1 GNAT family N-acetyltransferase [Gammaproteobacteria bacterium]
MNPSASAAALVARLKHIADTSPTSAIDEALRLQVWTQTSPWHCKDVLCYCAQLAASVGEWRLAGLAAYQAQRLHLTASGEAARWGLPMLPGLEVAARQFNLVRHVPLRSKNVLLRRPEAGDRDFLTSMFSDPAFMRLYCRPAYGRVEWRVYHLIRGDQQCPQARDPWAWIVCNSHGEPLGLMELTPPNYFQGSADLALGFHQAHFGTLAAEAYVLGAFIAFHHLDLVRVTGHVYGDNHHSGKLDSRMGMVPEYTVEGMVGDALTGEDVAVTVYSMLRDEFSQWPRVKRIVRHFFSPTAPDLLLDQIDALSKQIVALGPSWRLFPPPAVPMIVRPASPDTREERDKDTQGQTLAESLPAQLDGRRVRLRALQKEDEDVVTEWLGRDDFFVACPHYFDILDDLGALLGRYLARSRELRLWLIEELSHGGDAPAPIGLIGLEFHNDRPLVFVVAGFVSSASYRPVRQAWRLIQQAIVERFPGAMVYAKTPLDSAGHALLSRSRNWQSCGIERGFRVGESRQPRDMALFRWWPTKSCCSFLQNSRLCYSCPD